MLLTDYVYCDSIYVSGCMQSPDWTGLDWTTAGLPLEFEVQHYIASYMQQLTTVWCLFVYLRSTCLML